MSAPLMSDAHARVTALLWCGGDWSELLDFASEGAIPSDTHDLLHEIAHVRAMVDTPATRQALDDLAHYVGVVGARPAPEGWSSLWDSEFAEAIR